MSRLPRWLAAIGCLALTTAALAPSAHAARQQGGGQNTVTLLLQLSLKPGLAGFVRQVSDPDSRHYRQYATPNKLLNRFGSTRQARRKTRLWARSTGARVAIDRTGLFATVTATPAQARALFGDATKATAAGARAWSPQVPPALEGAVAAVDRLPDDPVHTAAIPPGTSVPGFGSGRTRSGTPRGCLAGGTASTNGPEILSFTPNQYLTAYGHDTLHKRGLTGKGVRMGVLEIDGFKPADVQAFADCFGLKVPPINARPVGMKQLLAPGGETTADLQILTAGAPGVEAIDVYEGTILATLAQTLNSNRTRPDVLSLSLDGCENNYTNAVSLVHVLDAMFAILAGSGTTTLVATGDQGSTPCTNDADQILPIQGATYPSTSPYVTAVGGTNAVLNPDNTMQVQTVWNDAPGNAGATSGSQSLIFKRPWWQVGKGLKVNLNNGTTRSTPDVAALADPIPGYAIYCTAKPDCATDTLPDGGWVSFGGTSAATPLTAAGIVLADEAAARHGQPTLGLINPLIYKLANSKAYDRVLWDVSVGNNDVGTALPAPVGDGQPIGCCDAGPGYDPVTGWGSLKIGAFSDAALGYGRRATR